MQDKEWKTITDKSPEVKVAHLHKAVWAAGAIKTDTTMDVTKHPGIRMWWNPLGLLYEIKGVRGCVPAANVANMVYMKEETLPNAKTA